jgi:SHS family lactate transporter-like MFS transporter
MAVVAGVGDRSASWWREPTKDQWLAWVAGWLGRMLDAFDFTIFFLIMVPISREFGVPLTLGAGTVTFTLWICACLARLVPAGSPTASAGRRR